MKMQRKFSKQPSVLERAQKQLQGKRLSQSSGGRPSAGGRNVNQERKREDNDLDAYLSTLSRKVTLGSEKKTTSTLSDDLSDISISSDGDEGGKAANLSASRFVKKSQSQTLEDSGSLRRKSEALSGGTPLKKSATTPSFLNKTAPVYSSSALQKAATLGAKFSKQKQRANNVVDSESDFDVSLSDEGSYVPKNKTTFTKENISVDKKKTQEADKVSLSGHFQSRDEDNLMRRDDNKFLKKSSFYVGESDEEENNKFGRDGNKFLKKTAAKQPTSALSKIDVEQGDGSRFLKKSTQKLPQKDKESTVSTARTTDKFMTSTPKRESDVSSSKTKLAGNRPSQTRFDPDSDLEDLEEFIMNLSPSSSPDIPLIREKKHAPGKDSIEESKQPPFEKPKVGKRPATPAAKKGFNPRDSPSMDSAASYRSTESIVTESIEEDKDFFSGVHSNIMQLEDLEPMGISAMPPPKASTKQKSQVKDIPNEDSVSEISDYHSIKEDFFSGLKTVDDLLPRETFEKQDRGRNARKDSYQSDFDSADEIVTEAEKSISEIFSEVDTELLKRSGSRTPGDVYAEDTFVSSQSESLSQTKTSSRTVPDSQSEVTSEEDTRVSRDRRKTSSDSRDTLTRRSHSYSDDFDSRHTNSEVEDLSSDEGRTRAESVTHSRSFTSYTESRTLTQSETPRKETRKKKTKKSRDVSVQADGATSATHRWLRDLDLSALGSVTGIDPTPVAMHVINPQALEALTSYSPSILAMNEMLLSQLRHTQETIRASLRLHQSLVENIETDFSYTTVEETKEYIRRHRRPKLTMEEALAEVRQEMEDGHR